MVDVAGKEPTTRTATATAVVRMSAETAALLADGALPKGDAAAVARVAGIMAAKRTPELIPLCHPIGLDGVEVDVDVGVDDGSVTITATTRTHDRTGVEMEALVAAGVAAFTLYDMIKGVEPGAVVERVQVERKAGGTGGEWRRG